MNDIPPAFRRMKATLSKYPGIGMTDSFVGMTDEDVLKIAANALRMAETLPVGSADRAAQWVHFDRAMGELGSRMITHTLAKIHAMHERREMHNERGLPPADDEQP